MNSSPLPSFSRAWSWPLILLALAPIALYVFLAPRGFELTDEAFYILNAAQWRDFTAVYTQFGAFAELAMWLGDSNLAAMRIMTLVSLSGSAAYLGHEIGKHARAGEAAPGLPRYVYWLVGACAGLYFFGVLSTLRAPSYNTIALAAAAVATGLLLRGIDASSTRGRLTCALGYGFVMGICGLCKGSTGFLVGCLHLAYFLWANPTWKWQVVLQLLVGIALGLGLQLVIMTLRHPGWWSALQAGASLFSYDTGGKLGGMVNSFRWDIQRLMPWSPLALLGLVAWGGLLRSLVRKQHTVLVGWLVLFATAATVLLWLQKEQVRFWWPAALLLSTALILVQLVGRQRLALQRADGGIIGLGILLFSLPFAFSFGTNMSVLWHSQAASLFVVLYLVLLFDRLWQRRSIRSLPVVLALSLLCLPALVFQLRAAFDVESVYRLAHPLLEQRESWRTPVGVIAVDYETKSTLAGLEHAARQAGLQPGQAMLDFTGDGPGLMLALSSRPVGIPWLVGGYKNSSDWARRLVQSLPEPSLRGAWLLSSPDNPRTIIGWKSILGDRLGPDSHELVATLQVRSPSKWTKQAPPFATLCLWRPHGSIKPEVAPQLAVTSAVGC